MVSDLNRHPLALVSTTKSAPYSSTMCIQGWKTPLLVYSWLGLVLGMYVGHLLASLLWLTSQTARGCFRSRSGVLVTLGISAETLRLTKLKRIEYSRVKLSFNSFSPLTLHPIPTVGSVPNIRCRLPERVFSFPVIADALYLLISIAQLAYVMFATTPHITL